MLYTNRGHHEVLWSLTIVLTPPPNSFLKGWVGVKFNYCTQKGEYEKLKKGVEVWCRGSSSFFKKTGGVALFLFNFKFLKVNQFCITLCKIVLCIWRKKFFFCHHNFMKKGILSYLKMNLKFKTLKIDFW